jgi:hypothetical protein
MDFKRYLGDGLYASFDGYQIRLWAEGENGTHDVFLEPNVIAALMNMVREIQDAARKAEAAEITDTICDGVKELIT